MCSAVTDQQETNNALAALAKAGNHYALGQLWETNKGLLRSFFWKWYRAHHEAAAYAGITPDDLEQESFFAVQYAAEHYDPEKGAFSTYLSCAMQRQIQLMLCGDHSRNITGPDGKQGKASANPLNNCNSLDAPVSTSEGDPDTVTLASLLPDPSGQAALEAVDETIYNKQLHDMLERELAKLPESVAAIIRAHYYNGLSLKEAGSAAGVSTARAQQLVQNGLRKLRTSPAVRLWRVPYEEQRASLAWRASGFASWSAGGSVQERTVERLEAKGAYTIDAVLSNQAAELAAQRKQAQADIDHINATLAAALGMTTQEFTANIHATLAHTQNN